MKRRSAHADEPAADSRCDDDPCGLPRYLARQESRERIGRPEVKARPRVDAVLARTAVRAELEELKRLMGLAAHHHNAADTDGHLAASFEARAVALRIVDAVRAEPGNANLPGEELYRYVANLAQHELLGAQAKADRVRLFELEVRLPAGRPPRRRPRARQQLIDEIRARPDMPDWLIEDRGHSLGVWGLNQSDEPSERKRRIRRIRRDAAN